MKNLFLLALLFLFNGLDDKDHHGLMLSRTANCPIGGKLMNVLATVVVITMMMRNVGYSATANRTHMN